jgi:hypothetical protein
MPRELGLSAGQSLQRFIPVLTIGHVHRTPPWE